MMKMKMFEVKARAWVITFAVLITYHLALVTSTAQTFTQRVQQHAAGEGVVTIHHDKAIDKLVNGSAAVSTSAKSTTPSVKKPSATTKPDASKDKASASKVKESGSSTSANSGKESKDKKNKDAVSVTNNGGPALSVDTTATAPRHTMKVTGFRVQAYAGGNTRSDRQRAEHTGNVMRQLFPGSDVYVRFYSPRWVCRVGNYRTYEEAREVLLEVRKQGYESATIVKGKIVVPM
jgi:hypothetical protein